MRGRQKQAANRAAELKGQAREVAGQSGEALKDFAEQTGVAAKEFAGKARDAAKELVEQIDKAAKSATVEEPKRSRRALKVTLAVGAGIALFTNERVREAVSSVIRRSRGETQQPEVWRPEGNSDGDAAARAKAIAEETS